MKTRCNRCLSKTCRVPGTFWVHGLTGIFSTEFLKSGRTVCGTFWHISLAWASFAWWPTVGEGGCQTCWGGVNGVGTDGRGGSTCRNGVWVSQGDTLFRNSLVRTLRCLKDVVVCCNTWISFLSFGNFWHGKVDQRKHDMSKGGGKITNYFFIVSKLYSILHKAPGALYSITSTSCFYSRRLLMEVHHQLSISHFTPEPQTLKPPPPWHSFSLDSSHF